MLFFEHNMIKDIPSSDDFIASGEDFLNMDWDNIFDLLFQHTKIKASSDLNDEEDSEDIDNKYWKQVKLYLSTSLVLIQQGNEFLIKGKIAEKSPYLILSDDWYSGLKQDKTGKDKDISFSKLKTIEASNLIKVYNAVIDNPDILLTKKFQDVFDELRDKRNTIMHSDPKNLDIEYKDLLINILEISQQLIGKRSWIKTRKKFLENQSYIRRTDDELKKAHILLEIATEIDHVIELLGESLLTEYFGISDKTQYWYLCPHCYKAFELLKNTLEDYDEKITKRAQLKPKGPDTTKLYCLLCDKTSEVSRSRNDCNCEGCPGNVISDSGICMTCGNQFDES